ncbi:MAG TPA: DapH/DapD/GlmU-related protein [Rariglobus sp.]
MSFSITSLPANLAALRRVFSKQIRQVLHEEKISRDYPQVHIEWPVNFVVDDFSALKLGPDCFIGSYSEIVVLRQAAQSPVPGSLTVEAGVRFGMGANIRAAGGSILVGRNTQIGQHVSLIASNHLLDKAAGTVDADRWDPLKTGITIGENCWIGAGSIILPGVTIGNGTVIGAGSVVTKSIGARRRCHGNPARPHD